MRGLKDRVAVVTGGLGDLGFAIAHRLIEEGCRVAVLDYRVDADGHVPSIGARYFEVDITDEGALDSTFKHIERDLGPTSILVNSAACFIFKGVDATKEDFQRICEVNIAGTSLVTKTTVEHMKRAVAGSIINLSSV